MEQPFTKGLDQLTIQSIITKTRDFYGLTVLEIYLLKKATVVYTVYEPSGAKIELSIINKETGEKVEEIIVPDNLIIPLGENSEDVYLPIHNYVTSTFLLQAETSIVHKTEVAVLGELKPNKEEEFIFTCSPRPDETSECLYPLPGTTPYTITNPHPDLYELYFVSKDGETLITSQNNQFNQPGNLKAKKVAQQVVFVNTLADENEEDQESKFYGCEAASFVGTGLDETSYQNLDYCNIKAGQFCSPSVKHSGSTAEQKGFTTINSWSDEPLEKVGYEEADEGSYENDPLGFYSNTQLLLRALNPSKPLEGEAQR
ncbi:MAG: hypothetical protein AABX37_00865, partial [Nanoarchaeota archaeon]